MSRSPFPCARLPRDRRIVFSASLLLLTVWIPAFLPAATVTNAHLRFEKANAHYETGQYTEAAQTYQGLIEEGVLAPELFLNLGNAWFKAEEMGRAIAAYRTGLHLAPRDPDLRFNLQHVREEVHGSEAPPVGGWQSWFTRLTLNEWTIIFMVAYWIWALLLILREWRPALQPTLHGYTTSAGIITALLLGCMAASWQAWIGQPEAVVTTPEAVVRYGPLEASQMHFQLRDGNEVLVLDEKVGETSWVQIQAPDGREGWLKKSEVAEVPLATIAW